MGAIHITGGAPSCAGLTNGLSKIWHQTPLKKWVLQRWNDFDIGFRVSDEDVYYILKPWNDMEVVSPAKDGWDFLVYRRASEGTLDPAMIYWDPKTVFISFPKLG